MKTPIKSKRLRNWRSGRNCLLRIATCQSVTLPSTPSCVNSGESRFCRAPHRQALPNGFKNAFSTRLILLAEIGLQLEAVLVSNASWPLVFTNTVQSTVQRFEVSESDANLGLADCFLSLHNGTSHPDEVPSRWFDARQWTLQPESRTCGRLPTARLRNFDARITDQSYSFQP